MDEEKKELYLNKVKARLLAHESKYPMFNADRLYQFIIENTKQ